MIAYRKKSLQIAEYWNQEEPDNPRADLIRRFQQSQPLPEFFCREFYTILVDLRADEQQLLDRMKQNTRYEIKRAEHQDRPAYDFFDKIDREVLQEFVEYYESFARQRQQPKANRAWLT